MTQEEKELLLKDLCARLPYDVKVTFQVGNNIPDVRIFEGKDYDYLKYYHFIDEFTNCTFKPYLRPMSSMTEEEKVQLSQYACIGEDLNGEFIDEVQRKDCAAYIDWLNKHHFDYRGLIERGLAIEAPEGMYK